MGAINCKAKAKKVKIETIQNVLLIIPFLGNNQKSPAKIVLKPSDMI